MTTYKYCVYDNKQKINNKCFNNFEDAYDYAQTGLDTYIEKIPVLYIGDSRVDEGDGVVIWTSADKRSRSEVIKDNALKLLTDNYKKAILGDNVDFFDSFEDEDVDEIEEISDYDLIEEELGDNAVKDCKVNKVIAHSADEKPVCKVERPLDKPLTDDPDITKQLYENITSYKGFDIEYDLYGNNEYSVQYQGDDIIFKTEEAAKQFIDTIAEEDDISDEDFLEAFGKALVEKKCKEELELTEGPIINKVKNLVDAKKGNDAVKNMFTKFNVAVFNTADSPATEVENKGRNGITNLDQAKQLAAALSKVPNEQAVVYGTGVKPEYKNLKDTDGKPISSKEEINLYTYQKAKLVKDNSTKFNQELAANKAIDKANQRINDTQNADKDLERNSEESSDNKPNKPAETQSTPSTKEQKNEPAKEQDNRPDLVKIRDSRREAELVKALTNVSGIDKSKINKEELRKAVFGESVKSMSEGILDHSFSGNSVSVTNNTVNNSPKEETEEVEEGLLDNVLSGNSVNINVTKTAPKIFESGEFDDFATQIQSDELIPDDYELRKQNWLDLEFEEPKPDFEDFEDIDIDLF